MKIYKLFLTVITFLIGPIYGYSQYAPAAGKLGSTALHKDSSIFVNWANHCSIIRGWKNIAQKDSGYTTVGDSTSAIGRPGQNGIVSLGDSGVAICTFDKPIINKNGWDFAVFENTFDDRFLELAFVEVSSNGVRYFKFPCHSLSDTNIQTGGFGYTEPENINNLAGKYRSGYGTPFDLSDLPDYKDLDKNNIRYVKIVDVVGSLNSKFASYDTALRKINDPWPTPFASGGFDLDAIGVINEAAANSIYQPLSSIAIQGPNPISKDQVLQININEHSNLKMEIFDSYGRLFSCQILSSNAFSINGSNLPMGLFFIRFSNANFYNVYKGIGQ